MIEAIVTDIQRFSIHDGPGIRSTVFLKGCPLRCPWCHNPECLSIETELFVYTEAARDACHRCRKQQPQVFNALAVGRYLPAETLDGCARQCAESVYSGDAAPVGRPMSIDEVIEEVRKDADYYGNTGGGVTFSGGEPLMQADFVTECLGRCKDMGFHTAIDTCGEAPWEVFERVLPRTDLFLYDLKHADPAVHERMTGLSNARILANLRRLAATGANILISVPVVPGFTDDLDNARGIGRVVRELEGAVPVRLLPYHRFSRSKYKALGLRYAAPDVSPEQVAARVEAFRRVLTEQNMTIVD